MDAFQCQEPLTFRTYLGTGRSGTTLNKIASGMSGRIFDTTDNDAVLDNLYVSST